MVARIKRYLSYILMGAVLLLGFMIPSFALATGDFNTAAVSASMSPSLESQENLFGSHDPVEFDDHCFKLHIDYKIADYGEIAPGTKVTFELKPDKGESYLSYPSTYAQNKTIIADNGDKLADIDISGTKVWAQLTFPAIDADFTIDLNSTLTLHTGDLYAYFEKNPDATHLEQTYSLYINGVKQQDSITFMFAKPQLDDTEVNFVKTKGFYGRSGTDELGEGEMLYNIKVATELAKMNEFFIYDMPDVNLTLSDDFSAYYATGDGKTNFDANFFWIPEGWQKIYEGDKESRMEVELYDVYFLTEEAASPSMPRQAGWEEKILHLDRYDVINKKQGLDSIYTATVPKNILLEKHAGEELTAEEQAKIDAAGGLHKTVGKGFKLHIKNFDHPNFTKGGFFTLIFRMDIVNPSPALDEHQNPVYYNTASYYAQEIPTCNPEVDEHCEPIKSEKTKIDDVAKGNYTTKAVVEEGEIGGTVDEYTSVEFTKQDENNKPLAGATFTIYQSDANNAKGQVARNEDNVVLENLVTNDQGKLCITGQDNTLHEVVLSLKRGYYLISETQAPKGYTRGEDVFFTVGFKADPIVVKNTSVTPTPDPVDPPTPTPDPVDPPTPDPVNPPAPRPTKPAAISSSAHKRVVLPKTGDDTLDAHWIIVTVCCLGVAVLAAGGMMIRAQKKVK